MKGCCNSVRRCPGFCCRHAADTNVRALNSLGVFTGKSVGRWLSGFAAGSPRSTCLRVLCVQFLLTRIVTSAASATTGACGVPTNWTISVMVPSPDELESRQVIAAVRYALTAANQSFTSKRGGLSISLRNKDVFYDSNDAWSATQNTLEQLQSPSLLAVIGMASSSVIRAAAPITHAAGVPILTPWAEDSDLTSNLFPGVFRLRRGYHYLAEAIGHIILHYHWTKVSFLYSDLAFGESLSLTVKDQLGLIGVDVEPAISISLTYQGNLSIALQNVKFARSKVIVVSLPVAQLLPVFRAANRGGLLVEGYAWIVAPLADKVTLLSEELQSYLRDALIIRPHLNITSAKLFSFTEQVRKTTGQLSEFPDGVVATSVSAFAYDAVQALVIALQKWYDAFCERTHLNSTLPLKSAELTVGQLQIPSRLSGSHLFSTLRSTQFEGLSGHVDLSQTPEQREYTLFNWVRGQERLVGKWTEGERWIFTAQIREVIWPGGTTKVPYGNYHKGFLNVLVPMSAPFSFIKDEAKALVDNRKVIDNIANDLFEGVAIEMFAMIANRTGLKYKLMLWNSEKWTELVETVGNLSTKYDIGVGSITVTKDRSTKCTFTSAIYLSGLRMLVSRSAPVKSNLWVFADGLDWKIWLLLFFTFLVVAGLLMVLEPQALSRRHFNGPPIADSLFFSFSTFFFVQESAEDIRQPWARLFLMVVLFVINVIVSAYTANMVSILSSSHESTATRTFEFRDLLGEWVAARPGGSNWPYVTEVLGLRRVVGVSGAAEAVRCLRNGTVSAYIADAPHLRRIATANCDLTVAGRLVFSQQYAFPMKHNSPYLADIDRAIGGLEREGAVSALFKKYVPDTCLPVAEAGVVHALGLNDLGGVFLLAAIATGVSLFTKIFYMLFIRRKKVKTLQRVSDDKHTDSELTNANSKTSLSAHRPLDVHCSSTLSAGQVIQFNVEHQPTWSSWNDTTGHSHELQPLWLEKQL